MEFDKSKVFHVVNAEEAEKYIGKSGWFADSLVELQEKVQKNNPSVLEKIMDAGCEMRFKTNIYGFALFYPAPEPEYRPFETCEEVIPHKDRLMKTRGEEVYMAINRIEACTGKVWINGDYAESVFDLLVFADTGEPVGVKL